jgi:polyhydroxybutyrate depolymerase
MRALFWAVLALSVTMLGAGCASAPDSDSIPPQAKYGEFPDESLTVDRTKRVYRLFVPTSVALNRPAPLVVAFHGMLVDSKDVMPRYTKLNETAERHGFIMVYANAVGGVWGILPDRVSADVAFFDALLAHLSKTYRIDRDRVYVLGMSNGGYFAQLLATERSTTIAAVASHSGVLGLQTLGGINAKRKFPVMIVHGTGDFIFPVAFARENVDRYRREGHEVNYVEVPGLGHAWASEADVNERIWAFFAAHPLDSPSGKR